MAVTGSNGVVVASEEGVKMYVDALGRWINLGYPNYPGRGTGQSSFWVATAGNKVAVAFPDKQNGNRPVVKMLQLQ